MLMEQEREPVVRGIHAGRACVPGPRVSGPREECSAPGCQVSTNGGKPYCIEHIDQMPYVATMDERRIDAEFPP